MSNPPGSNCGSTPCSDDWFFHYVNSYSYGSLAGHKHSMNHQRGEGRPKPGPRHPTRRA